MLMADAKTELVAKLREELQKCGQDLLFNIRMGYFLSGSVVMQTILARLDYLLA